VANIPIIDAIQVGFWFLAAVISLYFSIGNARIWTSISTGFFLIFISEGYLVAPWVIDPHLAAIHSIVGTIAIMVMTFGFQEYYVFSRTLETGGSKLSVYLATAGVIIASIVFLLANPAPSEAVLRHIQLIANANWVFLSLINIDMIRKIYLSARDTPIAPGFLAFVGVFALFFVWRGSELYLQVYCWDIGWATATGGAGAADLARIAFSEQVHSVAGLLSSIAVGGTFGYLYRLMR
jgi:hypothetical protein